MTSFNKFQLVFSILILFGQYHLSYSAISMIEKLTCLRQEMKSFNYSAAIIVSEDEHQSEYVAAYDKRRAWISGFTGSSGIVAITNDKAALWTDGRYEYAASQELDDNWILMRPSDPKAPSLEKWLKDSLQKGERVFQNSKLTSISQWQDREASLKEAGLILDSNIDPDTSNVIDLIDRIWPKDERTPKPSGPLSIHALTYAGKTVKQKLDNVIKIIKDIPSEMFVVTALDEIAWLFNMRGTDLPNNPMFYAYAIINARDGISTLYTNESRLNQEIKDHLTQVEFKDYDKIYEDISRYSNQGFKIWISPLSSYAIYNSVSNKKNLYNAKASPIRSLKAVKDTVELENTRRCQIRDSIARIRHMYWLETEMEKGSQITEKSAALELAKIEEEDSLFRGVSFNSISAVGGNAAIIHYATENGNDEVFKKDKIYLLDAGGQYLDCSTDITRTHHFGTPTAKEITAYTRVLQGSIELAKLVFPKGVYGSAIDVKARAALWELGLDYAHGTGHGIGYYLSIHEAPPTTNYNSKRPFDEPFAVGMIQSDEPGFYEDEVFGIRLETDIEVVEAKTKYNQGKYLTFESLTWVPFEPKLIDQCVLTDSQVDWLNRYNKMTREKVGDYLKEKHPDVYKFLLDKTVPFKYAYENSKCAQSKSKNNGQRQYSPISKVNTSILLAIIYFIKQLI